MTAPVHATTAVNYNTSTSSPTNATALNAESTPSQQIAALVQANQNMMNQVRSVTEDRDRRLAAAYAGRNEERNQLKNAKIMSIVGLSLGIVALVGSTAIGIGAAVAGSKK